MSNTRPYFMRIANIPNEKRKQGNGNTFWEMSMLYRTNNSWEK